MAVALIALAAPVVRRTNNSTCPNLRKSCWLKSWTIRNKLPKASTMFLLSPRVVHLVSKVQIRSKKAIRVWKFIKVKKVVKVRK